MRSMRKTSVAGVLAIVAVIAGSVTTYSFAQEGPADEPPPLVEDYAYPGADQIFAERGITLLKGDGHILLADCAASATGQIALRSSQHADPICFKVTGATGWLSMSIPEVYSVKGDGHSAEATLTTDEGATTSKTPITKNAWTPINAGDGATLLELKAWT